jgi:hypothetical protein
MRTFNGLQIFTEQLTNSGQLDARYIVRSEVLGPEGQADFGVQSLIKPLSVGGVIAGGTENIITGDFASVGGGTGNVADLYAFVGGGSNNRAIDTWSVIGGGADNTVGSYFGIIGGGCNNFLSIRPKTGPGSSNAPATYSSIINGNNNIINGNWSLIGGGLENLITGAGLFAFNNILGGWCNSICDSEMSTILGGRMNAISGQDLAQATPDFIGGGCLNKAYNHGNFIGGGQNNTTDCYGTILNGSDNCASCYSVIIGGALNIASYDSFIGAGVGNTAAGQGSFIGQGDGNTADGLYSFIGNGYSNSALADYSYIVGGVCSIIDSNHTGAAILGDSQFREHNSSGPNTLTLDFDSGVYVSEIKKGPKGYLTIGEANGILEFTNENFIKLIRDGTTVLSTEDGSMAGWFIYNSSIDTTDNDFNAPTGTIPSSNYPGTRGQIKFDKNYLYYCKENNKWIRTALAEW